MHRHDRQADLCLPRQRAKVRWMSAVKTSAVTGMWFFPAATHTHRCVGRLFCKMRSSLHAHIHFLSIKHLVSKVEFSVTLSKTRISLETVYWKQNFMPEQQSAPILFMCSHSRVRKKTNFSQTCHGLMQKASLFGSQQSSAHMQIDKTATSQCVCCSHSQHNHMSVTRDAQTTHSCWNQKFGSECLTSLCFLWSYLSWYASQQNAKASWK